MSKHSNRKHIAALLIASLLQACGGSEDSNRKSEDMAARTTAQGASQPKLGVEDIDTGAALNTANARMIDVAGKLQAFLMDAQC